MNQKTMKYRTLDVTSITKDVGKQWWAILLFSLAVALLVNVVAGLRYTPIYSTSTTFVVTTRGTNTSIYQNITNASETASRFRTILESNILRRAVAKDLQVEEYDAVTEVQLLEETNLMVLTVKHPSAIMAYKYIHSIMKNYSTVSEYVIKNAVLDVLQQPTIPLGPSNYNKAGLYSRLGFLLGLAIAIFYVSVFSYLKDTVKNANEASTKLAARYLGSVYHEKKGRDRKRAKPNSMLISNPILSFMYTESCRMVATRVRSRMNRKKAKVILVTSVAENEGKSTIASNIALTLAQAGEKVLLIDADFRKPSLHRIFDLDKDKVPNLVEILRSGEGMNRTMIRLRNYPLFCVFNNTNTGTIDDILANSRFKSLIQFARSEFDVVILDTAPMGLVPDAEGIAQFCDASLIVVKEDTILTKSINDAIDTMNGTKANVIGTILNNARKSRISAIHTSSAYNYGRK